jgi:atypical dual specificity phosphatase
LGRTGRIYRRVRAQLVDKPTYFSWVIEGKLAASGLPSSAAQVRWLEKNGLVSVLTLTESPLPGEWFEGAKIRPKHISMADHAPPAPDKLWEAAEFIDLQVREGKPVLVHCLAGIGRTGSSIAAYMIAYQGKSAKEALEHLRKLRPGSVEYPQEKAVYAFEKQVKEARR